MFLQCPFTWSITCEILRVCSCGLRAHEYHLRWGTWLSRWCDKNHGREGGRPLAEIVCGVSFIRLSFFSDGSAKCSGSWHWPWFLRHCEEQRFWCSPFNIACWLQWNQCRKDAHSCLRSNRYYQHGMTDVASATQVLWLQSMAAVFEVFHDSWEWTL